MNITKIIKRVGLFMAMPMFALGISISSCDNTNRNTMNTDADQTEEVAEPVATDTVAYVPDEVDTMLVIQDTIKVTPDTAGRQEDIRRLNNEQ
jgi:hypothetical protein